jgi:hypothetical protein
MLADGGLAVQPCPPYRAAAPLLPPATAPACADGHDLESQFHTNHTTRSGPASDSEARSLRDKFGGSASSSQGGGRGVSGGEGGSRSLRDSQEGLRSMRSSQEHFRKYGDESGE